MNSRKKAKIRSEGKRLLPGLIQEANFHHKEAKCAWRGALEHALKSGKALNKARYYSLSWKRGLWKKWLEDNFDASPETAKVYMRVAKKWDDPRLKEARKKGIEFKSIKSVLDILQCKPDEENRERSEREEMESLRAHLRKEFGDTLHTLCREELLFMEANWDHYAEKFLSELSDLTSAAVGHDINEYVLQFKKPKREWKPTGFWPVPPKYEVDTCIQQMERQERVDRDNDLKERVTKKILDALNGESRRRA